MGARMLPAMRWCSQGHGFLLSELTNGRDPMVSEPEDRSAFIPNRNEWIILGFRHRPGRVAVFAAIALFTSSVLAMRVREPVEADKKDGSLQGAEAIMSQ